MKCFAFVVLLLWLMCDVCMWSLMFIEHERLIDLTRDVGVLYMHLPIHKHERYGED